MKPLWPLNHCVGSRLSNETYSPKKGELGITSVSPRAFTSVTSILVYSLYFVYIVGVAAWSWALCEMIGMTPRGGVNRCYSNFSLFQFKLDTKGKFSRYATTVNLPI